MQFGYNHVVCLCGEQFCYDCGQPWKICSCPKIDFGTLRRQTSVRTSPVNVEESPEGGLQLDCAHIQGRWPHISQFQGGMYIKAECPDCKEYLHWLLHCRLCGLRVCVRCMYARRRIAEAERKRRVQ